MKMKTKKISDLDVKSIDRIVEMAWEDRTPFAAIEIQYLNKYYNQSRKFR